jgi:hypothetical protein
MEPLDYASPLNTPPRFCVSFRMRDADGDIQSHWSEQVVISTCHDDVVSPNIDHVNACFRVVPFACVFLARKDWDFYKTAGKQVGPDLGRRRLPLPIHKRLLCHTIDSRREHVPVWGPEL